MSEIDVPGMLASRDTLLASAADRARAYLAAIDARRVPPTAEAVAALDQFDVPLPERGLGVGAGRDVPSLGDHARRGRLLRLAPPRRSREGA